MARKGYDGASIGDVASAARLAPGIVHYHFKDKQEILLVALRTLVEQHDAEMEAQLAAAGGDARRALIAFVDFHLGLGAHANPEALACWVMLGGEALRQPKIRTAYETAMRVWAERLEGIIAQGIADRSFDAPDPASAAAALLSTIQGYFVLAAVARDVIPSGSAAGATKRMADGLLRPRTSFNAEERS
jgi:TetR/AcrR family transcriptional repressor of bet genes